MSTLRPFSPSFEELAVRYVLALRCARHHLEDELSLLETLLDRPETRSGPATQAGQDRHCLNTMCLGFEFAASETHLQLAKELRTELTMMASRMIHSQPPESTEPPDAFYASATEQARREVQAAVFEVTGELHHPGALPSELPSMPIPIGIHSHGEPIAAPPYRNTVEAPIPEADRIPHAAIGAAVEEREREQTVPVFFCASPVCCGYPFRASEQRHPCGGASDPRGALDETPIGDPVREPEVETAFASHLADNDR